MAERYKTEIDPVTGYPKEDKPLDPTKVVHLTGQKERAEVLKASIASETGQAVLLKIQEHLMSRVSALMRDDPESRVLMKLLVDMGITVNIGQMAVQRLMKMVTK